MSAILRPHQVSLLEQIDSTIASGCTRLVAQAPTGYGKTLTSARRLHLLQEAGKRALFIVPALSLIDQTVEKLYAEGVTNVGVIQGMHHMTNYARLIQVASVQTLMRRQVPTADEIHIDEVHRWHDFYPKLLADERFASTPIIGWSATPWRRGLGKHFDKLIIGSTTQELINAGYLSPFRVFAPASPDLTGVRTVAGDYHEGDLAGAMNKTTLVADVVTEWLQRAEGRPTLVFAVDRAHAKHLQQQFLSEGVPAEYIDAFTPAAERNVIAGKFRDGSVRVVCNVGCLTTGIDWDVRCIILARPTRSEMLFVQMIGRGLRTAESKADCLILDHSDNHTRLGFVTDIRHNELDDGLERKKAKALHEEPLPKKCPKCTFVRPPKMHVCPCCGFAPIAQPRAKHVDGELIEFNSRTKPVRVNEQEHRQFYGELKRIAETRGYKPGWLAYKFKEKTGSFPPFGYHQQVPSCTPSQATLRWVQSRNMAFAKARGAA
jgi:DNA repair protein RadD